MPYPIACRDKLSYTCRKIRISQLAVLTRRQGKLCEKIVSVIMFYGLENVLIFWHVIDHLLRMHKTVLIVIWLSGQRSTGLQFFPDLYMYTNSIIAMICSALQKFLDNL